MDGVLPEAIGSERVRLRLRTWRPEDVEVMAGLVASNLEHLRPWMPWVADEPMSMKERLALIATWERDRLDGGDAVFAVMLDGAHVGGCGLHRRIGPSGLEVGYWIAATHLHRGLASAATALLTTAAFAEPGIETVEVRHNKANVASAGVPKRLGFTVSREVPHVPAAPGEVDRGTVWRMRRKDWPGVDAFPHLLAVAGEVP